MQSYKIIVIISVLLTLLIVALYINFFVIPHKSQTKTPGISVSGIETLQKEIKAKSKEPEKIDERFDLPPLNDSDGFVRKYLKKYLTGPYPASWLNQNDLIRRFVAVVDNIANGENPTPNLKFLVPEESFQILEEKNQLIPDPQNYSRFDTVLKIFFDLKTETMISLYQDLNPLMNRAYAEMGYPGKKFDDTLMQAIEILLETPANKSPIYLEKKVITYTFKNPELETLPPAQKLLLRTGPENMRKIKEKLKQIKQNINHSAGRG